MNTKWFIVGCIGILFVLVVGLIGGMVLWQMPRVRNFFSGTKQQAQQNPNPVSSRPAPLQPAAPQQEPLQPPQYNASNNSQLQSPQSQENQQQQPVHNQKQKGNRNQTDDVLKDDYPDNEEFDNTGVPGPDDGKIYNGFDDFGKNQGATSAPSKPSAPQNRSIRTVEAHGIQTVAKSFGGCTGLAPNTWEVSGAENRVAIGIDFRDNQMLEGATYMVANVPVAIVNGMDFYNNSTPARYIQGMLTTLGVSGFQYTSQGVTLPGGFVLVFWQGYTRGQPVRGFAHYMTFQSTNGYIIALRYGFAPVNQWAKRMYLVYDVAASARCQKRLFPVQNSGGYGSRSSASREPQGSKKDLGTLWEETTMEFQNVYSPTTGQHWEASYDDYNPTGPDGPGYYRQVGNSYEKLEEGFPP